MTKEEMKTLKIGDIVKDLEASKTYDKDMISKVILVDKDGVVISSVNANDGEGNSHRFTYDFCFNKLEFIS